MNNPFVLRSLTWMSGAALFALSILINGCGSATDTSGELLSISRTPLSRLTYYDLILPVNFVVGTSLETTIGRSIIPTVDVLSAYKYSVTPQLPQGIVLDSTTGVISGAPANSVSSIYYTITASNDLGSASVGVTFSVVCPASLVLNSAGNCSIPPLTINGVTPSEAKRGTVITVTGRNFKDGLTLQVGEVMCTSIENITDTSFTCKVPSSLLGLVDLTVTVPDGRKAKLREKFRYRGVVSRITVGSSVCAILEDKVWCWGSNYKGQLGNGSTEASGLIPVPVKGEESSFDFISVSNGAIHTCGSRLNGSVWCWGDNTVKQLGHSSLSNSNVPIIVNNFNSNVSVSSGNSHTCALNADGGVWCWGLNSFGQLGSYNGSLSPLPVPGKVVASFTEPLFDRGFVVGISSGGNHTCALKDSGKFWCWGANDSGQLGQPFDGITVGSAQMATSPRMVNGLPIPSPMDLSNPPTISSGGNHVCVIASVQGSVVRPVYCWGSNDKLQLGRAGVSSGTPGQVPSVSGAIAVTSGYNHTCVLMNDSSVKCWGDNSWGQLGNGAPSFTGTSVPALVSGLGAGSGVTAISAGNKQTCAIKRGGVMCWGGVFGSIPKWIAGLEGE